MCGVRVERYPDISTLSSYIYLFCFTFMTQGYTSHSVKLVNPSLLISSFKVLETKYPTKITQLKNQNHFRHISKLIY